MLEIKQVFLHAGQASAIEIHPKVYIRSYLAVFYDRLPKISTKSIHGGNGQEDEMGSAEMCDFAKVVSVP